MSVLKLQEPVDPFVFDSIAEDPDNPEIVRYSPSTGSINAATPERLIAHITSPNFLDYELLSDFFLTFRAYLSPDNLLHYLMVRLEWAVQRNNDFARIVRVRTFVALRHWLLNYFLDDFAADWDLRSQFCGVINELCERLHYDPQGDGSALKILGELKKCWRRICAMYWDYPTFDGAGGESAMDRIFSGGNYLPPPQPIPQTPGTDYPDAYQPGAQDVHGFDGTRDAVVVQDSAQLEQVLAQQDQQPAPPIRAGPISRHSDQSIVVRSCTLPFKSTRQGMDYAAHLTEPLSDEKTLKMVHEVIFAGKLIRGDIVAPEQPMLTDATPPSPRPSDASGSDEDYFEHYGHLKAPWQAYHGRWRLLGEVRRVLTKPNRNESLAPLNGGDAQTHLTKRGHDVSSPSILRMSSKKQMKPGASVKPRMDYLMAMIDDSFHKLMMFRREMMRQQSQSFLQAQTGIPPQMSGTGLYSQPLQQVGSYGLDAKESRSTLYAGDPRPDIPTIPVPKMPSAATLRTMGANTSFTLADEPPLPSIPPQQRTYYEDYYPEEQVLHSDQWRHLAAERQMPAALSTNPLPPPWWAETQYRGPILAPDGPLPQISASISNRSASPALKRHASYEGGMATGLKPPENLAASRGQALKNEDSSRPLRRRPGGDLRAVGNVNDLVPIPRPFSTGSLSNITHSIANSVARLPAAVGPKHGIPLRREQHRRMSHVATHSSQPDLRPSFETEVARFALLPDEDDGGVAIALAKLEGNYVRKPAVYRPTQRADLPAQKVLRNGQLSREKELRQRSNEAAAASPSQRSSQPVVEQATGPQVGQSGGVEESYVLEAPYSSVPLLARGVSDILPRRNRRSQGWNEALTPPGPYEGQDSPALGVPLGTTGRCQASFDRFRHGVRRIT